MSAANPAEIPIQANDRAGFDLERPELRQRQTARGQERQADDSGVRDGDDRPRPPPALRSKGAEECLQSALCLRQGLAGGEPEAIRRPLPLPELLGPAGAHLTLRKTFPRSEAKLAQSPIDRGACNPKTSCDDLGGSDRPTQRARHDGRDAMPQEAPGGAAGLAHPGGSKGNVATALIPPLRRPSRLAVSDEIDRRAATVTRPCGTAGNPLHDNAIPAIAIVS